MNRLFLLQLILWIACSLQVNVSLAQCADTNGNGVCDTDETGCTIESACNYDAEAVIEDNGSCDYCSCGAETALVMSSNAAGYGVLLEVLASHEEGALAGYATYRLYLTTLHSDDVVSSVVGDDQFPLSIQTTGTFFQEPIFGGPTPANLLPGAVDLWPDLAWDSWVTVGIDGPAVSADGEVNITLLPGSWVDDFESGTGFLVDSPEGSGWYTLPPNAANGLAGPERRVLLAQLTTDGDISGSFRSQVFVHGVLETDVRVDIAFDSAIPEGAVCGCTDAAANNFNPFADVNDGSCLFDVLGCLNPLACNYDANASQDDGSCDFVSCLAFGCTDESACNFDAEADYDDGGCTYANFPYGCDGTCLNDADNDGVCDEFEVLGCTDPSACNYQSGATSNDGSCTYNCLGCTNSAACNYDPEATFNDGSCTYPASPLVDCDGNCVNDVDGDGLCDEIDECIGAFDACGICNGPGEIYECGCADIPEGDCDCDGNQLDALGVCGGDCEADEDGDGICDDAGFAEGCVDIWACNYDPGATLDDGTCEYSSCLGCIYTTANNYDDLASLDDGSCIFLGCTDDEFASYSPQANQEEDGDCTNAPGSADFNQDGMVQLEDLVMFLQSYGLTGPEWGGVEWIQESCNVTALTEAEMWTALLETLEGQPDLDNPAWGCLYPGALNYNPEASFDVGLCLFAGCTDPDAFNFDELATIDNGACNYEVCPDFDDNGEVQISDLMDFLLLWGN